MDKKKALKVLELDKNATEDEIRQAYYRLAKANHPDRNKTQAGQKKFLEVTQAYKTLTEEKSGGWLFEGGLFDFIKAQDKANEDAKASRGKQQDQQPAQEQEEEPAPQHQKGKLEDALETFREVAGGFADVAGEGVEKVSKTLTSDKAQDRVREVFDGLDSIFKSVGVGVLSGAGDKAASAMDSVGKSLKRKNPPKDDDDKGPKPPRP